MSPYLHKKVLRRAKLESLFRLVLGFCIVGVFISCGESSHEQDNFQPSRDEFPEAPEKRLSPFQLRLSGNERAAINECVGIEVAVLDQQGGGSVVDADVSVTLSGGGKGEFFATPSCANPFNLGVISSIAVIRGENRRLFYFKDGEIERVQITALKEGLRSSVFWLDIIE